MRNWILNFVWLMVLAVGRQAGAIAVADLATAELPPSNESFFGSTFNWDYVYNYKGATAVAVDHYWILTAGHVGDDGGTGDLEIDGVTYYQQEVVMHSKSADPDGNETADIALVRYDKPLPGYYLLADSVPVGQEIMICGYGRSGTIGEAGSGWNKYAYFTEDDTGHETKRWATNRIENEETSTTASPIVATTLGFDVMMSRPAASDVTLYEGGCNIFDSGGGMFYDDNGTWKLVGHMTGRYSYDTNVHAGNFAGATAYYVNWIKSVIPDYDTDMDGLPDHWESTYGSMTAEGDADFDGFSNYQEWVMDSEPDNADSNFSIVEWNAPTNVIFTSSAERDYIVEYRVEMDDSDIWQTEVDWFSGSAVQTSATLSTVSSNRFFRIRVRL